jgi:hypothetical protein
MAREVPIVVAELSETRSQQAEVAGFVVGDANPIIVELRGHRPKSMDAIPREIDRVELDVSDRMDEGREAVGRTKPASRDLARRNEPEILWQPRLASQG